MTLYKIKLAPYKHVYGYKQGVAADGRWIMEEKDTGTLHKVDRCFASEVVTYTIGVQFATKQKVYHYQAEPDVYNVGDFFIYDTPYGRSIAEVVATNTKSTSATKQFSPRAKLLTK